MTKKRLLVVEDNKNLLSAIAFSPETEGCDVMTACNGQEAFARVAETIPDLIVSDVMMPGAVFGFCRDLSRFVCL